MKHLLRISGQSAKTKSSISFYAKCAFIIMPISVAIIRVIYFEAILKIWESLYKNMQYKLLQLDNIFERNVIS